MRIHVTREIPQAALERLFDTGWDIFMGPDEVPSRQRFLWAVGGAVGLISTSTERVDAEAMDRCPDLRVISQCSASTDNIDLEEAGRRGIVVCHTLTGVPESGPGLIDEPTALAAVDNLIATLTPAAS